ncbi:uncharacterized protein LOC122332896 isoform X2 [Puntigrus tetrazona]|uniref:uncharacterized protein LOC122332896 isoform X2 n=1 Tax=Puntigrus tetrazona TaxID=1606681 RepID=UPI001C8A5196|nr:uncharacterized protein LOC122332896 isoform X2 [Puntigrus tetrazona]
MFTHWVFVHVLAALLLCSRGTSFSTPPSPSETPGPDTPDTPDTPDPSTRPPTTWRNTSSSGPPGNGSGALEDDLSAETTPKDPPTTEDRPDPANDSAVVFISSKAQPKDDPRQEGIVILILILILIAVLLGILYILRKKGRSYSFDLSGVEAPGHDYVDTPLRSDQHGVSYEQTNKDLPVCLDFTHEDRSQEKTDAIANGSAGEKNRQASANENDEQNVPEENSFSSSSSSSSSGYVKRVEFDLDLDVLGAGADPSGSTQDENENNNNVSGAGRGTAEEVFTEISLDESK